MRGLAPAATALLVATALALPAAAEDAGDGDDDALTGHVALAYRDVDVEGSRAKYDEDTDALGTGLRLDGLLLEWWADEDGAGAADHVRLEASGLGGDPSEHVRFDASLSQRYRLTLDHQSRRFAYDLFGLIGDEDGHAWATRSERTDLDLRWHASSRVDVVASIRRNAREGDTTFMKDFSRDVFLLDAPTDRETMTWSLGADLRLGDVRVTFRQALRDGDDRFVNETTDDPGLNTGNSTRLDTYDWLETGESTAHLTTVRVRAPIGDRVHVSAGYHGTLLGAEDHDTRADQDAEGTAFDGSPLLIEDGFAETTFERSHHAFDAGVAVQVSPKVTARLDWSVHDLRDDGRFVEDLDGTGAPETHDLVLDVEREHLTARIDVRPVRRLAFHVGYRWGDRTLERAGYEGVRDADFRSDDDSTAVAGLSWRPHDAVRIHAAIEESDHGAAFSPLSALDGSRRRIRLNASPRDDLDLGISWREIERENHATPSLASTESWSAFLRHRPTERIDWGVSWTRTDIERRADVIFDGAAFGGPAATFPGETSYDATQDHLGADASLELPRRWRVGLRLEHVELDGIEQAKGEDPNDPPAVPDEISRDLDWTDAEISVEKGFASGVFVGLVLRRLDHDVPNELLDYRADLISLRLGWRF